MNPALTELIKISREVGIWYLLTTDYTDSSDFCLFNPMFDVQRSIYTCRKSHLNLIYVPCEIKLRLQFVF
jgi:hypothetical protein